MPLELNKKVPALATLSHHQDSSYGAQMGSILGESGVLPYTSETLETMLGYVTRQRVLWSSDSIKDLEMERLSWIT